MSRFVEDVKVALRSAFESEEYRTRQQIIEEELRERREQSLAGIEQEALSRGVALLRTPIGFAFGPVKDGKVIAPEQFQDTPEEEKKRIQQIIDELQDKLKDALQQAPVWMKAAQDKIRELNDETAMFAVGHLVETLRAKYQDQAEVTAFLDQVRDDVIKHFQAFIAVPDPAKAQAAGIEQDDGHPLFRRYRVNLIVSSADSEHAPVVYEDEPSMDRLVGRVEHRAEMGALLTDLHMIRPGALHRANGGFLILEARKLLTRPMAWDALKHALSSGKIRTEPLGQAMGVISTITLEPESIPLRVKIALIGDREIYYLLAQHDPEFLRFFKVAADFDERFERSEAHNLLYARLVGTVARKERLRPFDRAAVGRVLERASRRAGDSERLSTEIEALSDLLQVSDHWAGLEGAEVVGPDHVQKAIDAHERQLDRMRERIQEEIQRDTIVIDTDGAEVGQINGLAVLQLGDFAFGKPSRITARVRLGKGEVIDIEREVALGGPLHAKGVLILSGYLSSHYASDRPLSLSASLVFEQSYGGVDGDSASSAELYALLSAIAEVPIRQSFAVTGSVNQRGEVQAIGGVNEKIEGFFDLCRARGLGGTPGRADPGQQYQASDAAPPGGRRGRIRHLQRLCRRNHRPGHRDSDRRKRRPTGRRWLLPGGQPQPPGRGSLDRAGRIAPQLWPGRQDGGRRMTDAGEAAPRRVVVAIDAGDPGRRVLEDAARLAARLEAELVGLLIEDSEQLAAADLPVTRLVPSQAGHATALDAAAMRRAYRVWSANSRRRVAATAEHWNVRWSCQSNQGLAIDQLLGLTRAGDLLALSAPSRWIDAPSTHRSIEQAACSVLLVQRCGTRAKTVAVAFQGREATLAAALDLAKHYRGPLLVLALGERPEDAAALEEQVRSWLQTHREQADIMRLSAPRDDDVARVLEERQPGTVVYDRQGAFAPLLNHALERQACSILMLC